ncbi:increased DNA methylation 1 [Andrographis paniculata]|uniref:increased DNA methylation 1 n=1 Tax=Andrographis paniculata TaxID=175694 RepID=UPI0021E7FA7B|nr:increased DNA methylation 1 [Andrographis paniculata]
MEGGRRSREVLKKKTSSSGCLIIKKKKIEDKKNSGSKGTIPSVSGSSDEEESLEFMRRRVSDKKLNGKIRNRDFGIENGSAPKKSRLDLFEFDEYDEFDGHTLRNDHFKSRLKNSGKFGNEFSSKRKQDLLYFDGSGSRNKGLELEEDEDEDEEANMPISLLRLKYRQNGDRAIRLQGKNGVLKVMVNKKKKIDSSSHSSGNAERRRTNSSCENDVKKDESLTKSKKGKLERGKNDYESENQLESPNAGSRSSKKRVEGKVIEEKAKRSGGSTEKQMLRDKIRGMLIDAKWTIDYRPRRNRNYLDAVYINPNGTAYWSIIKAYDALKKQLGDDNGENDLSEDLVNILTRQTKRKSAKKSSVLEATDSSENSDVERNFKSRSGKVRKMERPYIVSKVTGRCTLLVRGSDKGKTSDFDGYVPYKGKRTILGWLIDAGVAKLSEKVRYMNQKKSRVMLEGWLTKDGIHCSCCSKIVTVSKFELHAGSNLRQPFQNIHLESGSSLLQCQIDAWNSREKSGRRDFHFVDVDGDDPDDDTCGICGDGGDLVCCDSCPSTFHQLCLEIQMLPQGDWHCPNCTCKFCGSSGGNVSEENDTTGDELIKCSFCEKKYHKSCCGAVDSNDASFCGLKCRELYDHFQKILGVKHEFDGGFSWSFIQRSDVSDTSDRGFAQRVECNSKLSVALSVMDECFLPIIDRRSGINIIHNVFHNCRSNFNRLNYHGFYTVILERGDEIMSTAAVRLHGSRVAEMPFIGTREIYRRKGMCRRLLSVIEKELSSLKVEKLIIPAISEHMNTWTAAFGFHEVEDAAKKEMKSLNMLVFPGTDMLQKQLVAQENSSL